MAGTGHHDSLAGEAVTVAALHVRQRRGDVARGVGLLLAFTRRNPYLHRSPYVVKWGAESPTR